MSARTFSSVLMTSTLILVIPRGRYSPTTA